MYQRFLNNNDYLALVTEDILVQLTNNNEYRLHQAEESAEQSILEYLTENYEVEKELQTGKNLREYNEQITYPVGSHFYYNGEIYQVIKAINGVKSPFETPYWELYDGVIPNEDEIQRYTQRNNYYEDDIVIYGVDYYKCLVNNGPDFNQIRVPGVKAWEKLEDIYQWEPNVVYNQWDVVKYKESYYAMVDASMTDTITNPLRSKHWGAIGDYVENYVYELSEHEYVVYNGNVYYPIMNPNNDAVEVNKNVKLHDPRNANIKKHMLRLSVYEIYKMTSPTSVSSARITDYEGSINWLRDASKFRLNPQIPRKIASDNKPVADFATATYMRSYDPYENMWHI